METRLSKFLIIVTVIGAIYVAIQSIIWTIQAEFPITVVLYVAAIMALVLLFVGYVAKQVWKDIKRYDGE